MPLQEKKILSSKNKIDLYSFVYIIHDGDWGSCSLFVFFSPQCENKWLINFKDISLEVLSMSDRIMTDIIWNTKD